MRLPFFSRVLAVVVLAVAPCFTWARAICMYELIAVPSADTVLAGGTSTSFSIYLQEKFTDPNGPHTLQDAGLVAANLDITPDLFASAAVLNVDFNPAFTFGLATTNPLNGGASIANLADFDPDTLEFTPVKAGADDRIFLGTFDVQVAPGTPAGTVINFALIPQLFAQVDPFTPDISVCGGNVPITVVSAAVPVPAAAWGGAGLLLALWGFRFRRLAAR